MVYCAIKDCKTRWIKGSGVKLFKVPSIIKNQCEKTKTFSAERQRLWIARINRKDLKVTRNTSVCYKHFEKGAPASLFDNLNPDWAPSLFLVKDEPNLPSESQAVISKTQHDKGERRSENHNVQVQLCECVSLAHKFSKLNSDYESLKNELVKISVEKETINEAYNRVLNENIVLKNENTKVSNENILLKMEIERITNDNALLKKENETFMNDKKILQTEYGNVLSEKVLLRDNYDSAMDVLKKDYEKAINDKSMFVKVNERVKHDNIGLKRDNQEFINEIAAIRNKEIELNNEVKELKNEVNKLKNIVGKVSLDEDSLKGNDKKTKFYTGIPSFALLEMIFDLVAVDLKKTFHLTYHSLTLFQEFIIVMMRLRLNVFEADLGYRFNVSQSTISRILSKWLPIMAAKLKTFIVWPDRESLHATMPNSFKRAFGNRVTVIIDCFEVFTNTPSSLLPNAQTWSQYKHHNTVKFLIGITPQGSVSFISKAWGGRTSDKEITEKCGILDNLIKGDLVIADRGFTIAELVEMAHARLNIPAFMKGKDQLSSEETEETRRLANVRIHVERIIGQVRKKYTILRGTLPMETLAKREGGVSQIDDIVTVCCALVNLCPGIVSLE